MPRVEINERSQEVESEDSAESYENNSGTVFCKESIPERSRPILYVNSEGAATRLERSSHKIRRVGDQVEVDNGENYKGGDVGIF